MKNSADQGGYYPQRPKAEVDNTLLDLQNSFILLSLIQYLLIILGNTIYIWEYQ